MDEVKGEITGEVFDGEKEEEEEVVEEVEVVVKGLRERFKAGKTKRYDWRVSQLEGIVRMIMEREREIMEALQSDLAKPNMEAYLHEVLMLSYSYLIILTQFGSI